MVNARDQVRAALAAHGLNQKALAELMGLSEQYVSEMLTGRSAISIRAALAVQAVLGLDAEKLLHCQVSEHLAVQAGILAEQRFDEHQDSWHQTQITIEDYP